MKTNTLKKLLSVATSLSLAFLFATQSHTALASFNGNYGFPQVTLQPGEESRVGGNSVNDKVLTACDIDGTKGTVQFNVYSSKGNTPFTMFVKEKDKLISEKSFTGRGSLGFDSRKYETVTFSVKNDAQEKDTFSSSLSATSDSDNVKKTEDIFVCNGASRILTPIAALLGGLLLLF